MVGTSDFEGEDELAQPLLRLALRCHVTQLPALALERPHPADSVVILNSSMVELYDLIERMAQGKISILLAGETGVGKEVIAEAIHQRSPRSGREFLKLNCAALTEPLAESELFGHEKGAFTGAEQSKPGLLEKASGGTVLLDEVGELPSSLQAKLLRVIENQQLIRVGGLDSREIDVRFVAATNRDLLQEVEAGRFRRDLFFRLCGAMIRVPPLRERRSEIEPLSRLFIERASRMIGRERSPRLSPRAVAHLTAHSWPGNIRELRNVMERAVLVSRTDQIEVGDLALEDRAVSRVLLVEPPPPCELSDGETQRVKEALAQCGGNQTKAALLLGISRRTLTNRLNQLGLPRPKKSVSP